MSRKLDNLMGQVYTAWDGEKKLEAALSSLIPLCPCYDSRLAVLDALTTVSSHTNMIEQTVNYVVGSDVHKPKTHSLPVFSNFQEGVKKVLAILEDLFKKIVKIIACATIDIIRTLFEAIKDAIDAIIKALKMILEVLFGGK